MLIEHHVATDQRLERLPRGATHETLPLRSRRPRDADRPDLVLQIDRQIEPPAHVEHRRRAIRDVAPDQIQRVSRMLETDRELQQAARMEGAKRERPFSEAELRGWT